MKDPNLLNEFVEMITKGFELVDLSHTLEENMPYCPDQARYGHILYGSYQYGDAACYYQLIMSEHTGTHIDAPMHFIAQGDAHYGIDKVSLTHLYGRAATIAATNSPPNGTLTLARIKEWETQNGLLKTGDIVLVRFGWDRYWAKRPNDKNFAKDWPGLGADAAEYFVAKGIRAVGTDALSIDPFNSQDTPAHYILLGKQVLILENLNNLALLPSYCFFIALPLKIKDGSGSPIRAVAFVQKNDIR